jgi:hypothetical protein
VFPRYVASLNGQEITLISEQRKLRTTNFRFEKTRKRENEKRETLNNRKVKIEVIFKAQYKLTNTVAHFGLKCQS